MTDDRKKHDPEADEGAENSPEDRGAGENDRSESGGDEDVGYRKPPKRTQFRKGLSGNSKGRPKKGRNMRTIIVKSINLDVTMTIAGKKLKGPAKEAAFLRLQMDAISGKTPAQRLYIEKIEQYAPEELEATIDEMRLPADDRAILDRYLVAKLAAAKKKKEE